MKRLPWLVSRSLTTRRIPSISTVFLSPLPPLTLLLSLLVYLASAMPAYAEDNRGERSYSLGGPFSGVLEAEGYQNASADSRGYAHSTVWILGIGAASAAALISDGIAKDKKKHFVISVALGAASQWGLRHFNVKDDARWQRIALATAIGLVPGVIKEVTDSHFSKGDLVADAVGSFTGALLSDLMQGPVQRYPVVSLGLQKGDGVGLALNYAF